MLMRSEDDEPDCHRLENQPGTDWQRERAMLNTPTARPVPQMVMGCPVMAAIRDTEAADVWHVLCRRFEHRDSLPEARFLTCTVWWSEQPQQYEAENGHYDLTWDRARRDLIDRAGLGPGRIDEHGITEGSYRTGTIELDGQRFDVWVDRQSSEYCQVELCTVTGVGRGTAVLGRQGLRIELPDGWSPQTKARAAAIMAAAAYDFHTGPSGTAA